MMEVKDPEIKLFGMKIVLPETGDILPAVVAGDMSESGGGGFRADGSSSGSEGIEYEDQQEAYKDQNQVTEESENCKASSESENNPRSSPSTDEDSPTIKSSDTENEQNDASNSEQKPLKKPDKIIPCPRCNSMDTKFCYYNNYNVNQPRHFCKSCQRYWTAGGTMRNVPVGAGRRKNKNFASNCRHIMVSESLQVDHPNGSHHPTFKTNGTVLSFGSDSPLCESMASVLNIAEKTSPNGIRNGFYNLEYKNPSSKGGNNVDDCSSLSSISTSNTMVHKPVMQTINGFPSPVPCLPGVPWPFPCDVAVPLPVPVISPVGLPLQLCPVPYWNCNVPGPWSNPWLSPSTPTSSQKAAGSDPISPLGKHSREGNLLKPNNPEGNEPLEQKNSDRSILVPKTLRIDDPDEAAKSSIWSTLGIKYESSSRGGLFKALQQKSDDKDNRVAASLELNANPAALSRSLSFQERA